MTKKPVRNKTKFTSIAARLALCALGLYLIVSLVMEQVEIVSMRHSLEAAQEQLTTQQQQNDELRRVIESGNEDDYIERVAREKLGYARQNERIFQDTTSN